MEDRLTYCRNMIAFVYKSDGTQIPDTFAILEILEALCDEIQDLKTNVSAFTRPIG